MLTLYRECHHTTSHPNANTNPNTGHTAHVRPASKETDMTEYTPEKVAELVAEARERVQAHRDFAKYAPTSARLDGFYENYSDIADTLEAVTAERDEALREMHARELHHFEEEQARAKAEGERDEALAVIAEAAEHEWSWYGGTDTWRILTRITDKEQQ